MTAWGWVRRVGLAAVALGLLEYLVVPQLLEARTELRLFADASAWLLLLAFALEACSQLSYTSLTQVVLAPEVRLRFVDQLRIDLTGLGASHVLPGGGASAAALRYRLMTSRGVPREDALSTAAVQTAIAVAGLVATFSGGVALALPGIWSHPGYVLAAVAGCAALALLAWVARGGLPAPGPAPALVPHRRMGAGQRPSTRWLVAHLRRAAATGRDVATRSRVLLRQPGQRRVLLGWAAGNWLFDAASLWVCLWAYGVTVHPGALLAAYGAANLIGLVPVTPGGLGVVEGVLIPALIALGAQGGPVLLGVLTWRALEFWLPIPVAGLTCLSLRLQPDARKWSP